MATRRVEDQSREETKVLRSPHRVFLGESDRQLLEQIWGTMLNWNEGFAAIGAACSRIETICESIDRQISELSMWFSISSEEACMGDGDLHHEDEA